MDAALILAARQSAPLRILNSLEAEGEEPGAAEAREIDARGDANARGAATRGQVVDPVEEALADALLRAARAEAWDVVQSLTNELRARRDARAVASNVVRLPIGGRS